jgi:hypothetical protein
MNYGSGSLLFFNVDLNKFYRKKSWLLKNAKIYNSFNFNLVDGAGAERNIYGSATLVDIRNFYLPTWFFNFLYYTNYNMFLLILFYLGSL